MPKLKCSARYFYDGLEVGEIPDAVIKGKVTIPIINYIIDLLNKVYRFTGRDLDCKLCRDEVGNFELHYNYVPCCIGNSIVGTSDKFGVYWYLRNNMHEAVSDITNYLMLDTYKGTGLERELISFKNKFLFLVAVLDMPDYDYEKAMSKVVKCNK